MARYTNIVETNLSEQQINQVVFDMLTKKGFKQKLRDNEQVWQKGGALVAPQFIRVTPREGKAMVEGWLKFSVLPGVYYGEMDLTGAMGFAIKDALRRTLANLESALKG
jgi:hypothetical protein